MPYSYRTNLSKYRILRKHKRAILVLSVLLLIVLVIYGIFIWYIHQGDRNYQPQTDLKSKNFNPLETFKTAYFTFDTDKSWKFIPSESTNNKFVYRSFEKNITLRDLTVYIDSLPPNPLLTYVLPVEENNDRFLIGNISDHCKNYLKTKPGDNNPVEDIIDSVKINCQVDGTSYTAGTGVKGGSYQATLTRKDGQPKKYFLLYHDLEFDPEPSQFVNITQSFRTQ